MHKKQFQIINDLGVEIPLPNETIFKFAERMITERSEFLHNFLEKSHQKGFVLGLSGGVDSFVASMLAKKAGMLISISLPYGNQKDINDVLEAVKIIEPDNFITHDIKAAVDEQVNALSKSGFIPNLNLVKGNIMARERMSVQYSYASIYRCLVIGTDHATEAVTGFYTKHGDGAADIVPLAGLTKDTIYEMAKLLGAPENIVKKAPSAGLWEGQTDEDELGLSYKDLCNYLQGIHISSDSVRQKIESIYDKTEHKRHMPVTINDTWWK